MERGDKEKEKEKKKGRVNQSGKGLGRLRVGTREENATNSNPMRRIQQGRVRQFERQCVSKSVRARVRAQGSRASRM